MTVYNINHGIGWASSGVEYAQAYRSSIFKKIGADAKFIFTDLFVQDNLSDLTRNIGFSDSDIIWLYGWFTDIPVGPVTVTLDDLKAKVSEPIIREETNGKSTKLFFSDDSFWTVYFNNPEKKTVHRVEIVSRNILVRKDYYTSRRIFSEYYYPKNKTIFVNERHFYNQDGSIAYIELVDGKESQFKFSNCLLPSKSAFFDYFMSQLQLTKEDVLILDRSTDIGQSVFRYAKPARLGVVIHAEHFSENAVTDQTILWNNYYDYQFTNASKVDFFITATEKQKEVLTAQFEKYTNQKPTIVTIPVGSIDQLQIPEEERKKHHAITASRLASEKHVDWLVKAVIKARKTITDLTFDIYGSGQESQLISSIIEENQAKDYIRLMGHHDLSKVYSQYDLYLSASKSEGFGLTLLEAVGSGLPLIGFDVRYGNQTFISDGENGYLISLENRDKEADIIEAICQKIIQLYRDANWEYFSEKSYQLAQGYLTTEIEQKWRALLEGGNQND